MQNSTKKLSFYFENTTLHGFFYTVGRRHWIEKLFWIIAILSSLFCCILLLNKLISKVNRNPIIIDRPDTAIHIRLIPFPAISICPGAIQNGSTEIFSILHEIKNSSILGYINSRCQFMWVYKDCKTYDLKWKRFELGVPYWLPFKINWIDKFDAFTNLTISHFGWCKTFNLIDFNELFKGDSIAEYFKDDNLTSEISISRPYFTSKKIAGFAAQIQTILAKLPFCQFHTGCTFDSSQTTVVVHSPYELPDARHRNFIIENTDFSKITIEPQIKITDETLLDLDVDDRRCYMTDEHKLQYFQTYTSINCLKECESSFILQKCKCVPFYFINNDTSLICNKIQLDCFHREYQEFDDAKCKCYPPCDETSYEFTAVNMKSIMGTKAQNIETLMTITAKFKEDKFYPQIRRKYFTMIDWFSFVGGILGLFFGFSFLSVFEIVFHVWRCIFSWKSQLTQNDDRTFLRQPKRRNGNIRKLIKMMKNFLNNSSVHGLKYISIENVKVYERIAWVISFGLSITACGFMIRILHLKFTIDSISIISSNDFVNLSQIPFPAVTLISTTLVDVFSLQNIQMTVNEKTLNEDEISDYYGILHDIWRNSQLKHYEVIFQSEKTHNFTNYGSEIVKTMKKFTNLFKFADLMDVVWNGEYQVPTALVLTSMSFGRSFNIFPSHEMFNMQRISNDFNYSYENYFKGGYRSNANPHPWHSPYKNQEILEMTFLQMYYPPYIYLHRPQDYPTKIQKDEANIFEINFSNSYEILIIPEIVTTSDDLRILPLKQRMCFMDHERNLKFFKIYTQKNCEIECLSKKLLKFCNCIPFDIIRDNRTKVCELPDYRCVHQVQNSISDDESSSSYCNCLPPCNLISYNIEIVTKKLFNQDSPNSINFRFKENEFTPLKRVRQFTIFDFLSYIGGLLGLFAGISALSFFEVFYFFTLRFALEILKNRRNRRRVGYNNTFMARNED